MWMHWQSHHGDSGVRAHLRNINLASPTPKDLSLYEVFVPSQEVVRTQSHLYMHIVLKPVMLY